MTSALARCEVLLQGFNYPGSGNWLDESGNGHDATPVGSPTFTTDHFVLNGTTQTLRIADHADLDFAANEPLTVLMRLSIVNPTAGTFRALFQKSISGGAGYFMETTSTPDIRATIHDGTTQLANTLDSTPSAGVVTVVGLTRNVIDDKLYSSVNGTRDAGVSDTTTGSLANAIPLCLGSRNSADHWLACSVYAFALWREALSNADIAEAAATLVTGYIPPTTRTTRSPRYGLTRLARR